MTEASPVSGGWHSSNGVFPLLAGAGEESGGGRFVKKSFFLQFIFFKYPDDLAELGDSQWQFYWLDQFTAETGLSFASEGESPLALCEEDDWKAVIDCSDPHVGCVYFHGPKKAYRGAESRFKRSSLWIPLPLKHSWMRHAAATAEELTDFCVSSLRLSPRRKESRPSTVNYHGADAREALAEIFRTRFSGSSVNFLKGRILKETNLEISIWDCGTIFWENLTWNSFEWIDRLKRSFSERFHFWNGLVGSWEWEGEARRWRHAGGRGLMRLKPETLDEERFQTILDRECRKIKLFPVSQKVANGYTRIKLYALNNDGCLNLALSKGRLYCSLENKADIHLAWQLELMLGGLFGDEMTFGKDHD